MSINTKTIGELKDLRFFVPAYQRGYRWTEHEVTALLEDISEFSTEGNKRYCIQPLIVKHRDDGSYEVVDGQQRLTTIYIFMKIAESKTEYIPFDLEYETRKNSQEFLSLLPPEGIINDENIDYFHITTARKTINDWLDSRGNRFKALTEIFNKMIDSVFFIWYIMPPESDPIEMFTKVNLGKIPLTSAELIKALLLNKDNFSDDIYKRQMEVSLEWDKIEQGLHDDSFWYFLNQREQSGTRIDMLFELLAKEFNPKLPKPISLDQNYFSFLVFLTAMNDMSKSEKEKFVAELWGRVQGQYSEFRDWYEDLDKYHIIGYLISTGVKISEIVSLMRGKRKSAVMKDLIARASKTITGSLDEKALTNIVKGVTDSRKIRNLLLLFNIATLVCKSEKQYRFPFHIYKGEAKGSYKWDVEHIHANADDTEESDDTLWNLTLLDSSTNRDPRYAAKPFNDKRSIILDRESKGLFVPLCTKNIFLKAYTENPENMTLWGDVDKLSYVAVFARTLKDFFAGGAVR